MRKPCKVVMPYNSTKIVNKIIHSFITGVKGKNWIYVKKKRIKNKRYDYVDVQTKDLFGKTDHIEFQLQDIL